jgi:hypothetical protein
MAKMRRLTFFLVAFAFLLAACTPSESARKRNRQASSLPAVQARLDSATVAANRHIAESSTAASARLAAMQPHIQAILSATANPPVSRSLPSPQKPQLVSPSTPAMPVDPDILNAISYCATGRPPCAPSKP